jgi:hypothetical protein
MPEVRSDWLRKKVTSERTGYVFGQAAIDWLRFEVIKCNQ